MAKSRSTSVEAGRFQSVEEVVERLGWCDLAPGLYNAGTDKYGKHYRRALACGQYIDYTISAPYVDADGVRHAGGTLIEKVNFVPSKIKRVGTSLYGKNWASIVAYRQSADYVADMAKFEADGMLPADPSPAQSKAKSSKFVPVG